MLFHPINLRTHLGKFITAVVRRKHERFRLAFLPGESSPMRNIQRRVQNGIRPVVRLGSLGHFIRRSAVRSSLLLRRLYKARKKYVVRGIEARERLWLPFWIRSSQVATNDSVAIEKIHRKSINVYTPGKKQRHGKEYRKRPCKPINLVFARRQVEGSFCDRQGLDRTCQKDQQPSHENQRRCFCDDF